MDLTTRSYNCLLKAGVDTVEKLKQLTHDELMRIRNVNEKCAKEIEEKLRKFCK